MSTAMEAKASVMERALLRSEVEELYAEYVHCLDNADLERWPELFAPQCLYRVIPRDNFDRGLPLAVIHCESQGMLRDRVEALRRSSVFVPRVLRHILGTVQIGSAKAEPIAVQGNYLVLETRLEEETRILNAGRYLDELIRVDGVLRFKQRLCVFDSVLVPGSLVFPI